MKPKLKVSLAFTGLILFICIFSKSFSQDFWEKTNGPMGGDVLSMAINSNDDIFVGTSDRNGIFRSTDNGATWDHILISTWGTNFSSFNAMAINTQDHIFAGSWGYFFRSIDNGNTWKEIKIGNNYPVPDILSIDFNAPGEVFAGTENGVYHSSNNGDSWTQVGLAGQIINAILIPDHYHLFVGTDNGIYHSADNGNNWDQVGLANHIIHTIITPDKNHLFAGTDNGVYYSTDNGGNWTQVGLSGLSVCSLLANSVGNITAGSEKDGIFQSFDNGVTWMQVNNGIQVPPSECEASCIAINSLNQIYVGFLHGGIFRSSNNGYTWTKVGLVKGKIKAIACNPDGEIFAGSGSAFLESGHCGWMTFKSINDGGNWSQIDPVNANINAIAINKESGHIFIGAGVWAMGGPDGSPGVYCSADNGNTWERVLADLGCSHFYSVAISGQGDVYAGNEWGNIFRSTDNGNTWEYLENDLGGANSIATNSQNHIFVGGDGVYRSLDNGNNWTQSLSDEHVMSLALNADGDIFAGTYSNGVYLSIDNGESWENIGLPGEFVHEIVISPDSKIFAATDSSGVFRSTDEGATWESINSGLPTNSIYSLAISPSGHLFAGTSGEGVFRSAATVAVDENLLDPISLIMFMQNYPNPFTASTSIEFRLARPAIVNITIYNHLGEQIAQFEKSQPQGQQQVVWNTEELPAGIYFCVLKTNSTHAGQTLKLIKL